MKMAKKVVSFEKHTVFSRKMKRYKMAKKMVSFPVKTAYILTLQKNEKFFQVENGERKGIKYI